MDAIDKFSKAYKGSDDERDDVIKAYEQFYGMWDGIYETVVLSDPLEDEDRFRGYIDEAIEKGAVEKYDAYSKETKKARDARLKNARREGKEAMAYAEKLGVSEKLFGKKGGDKGGGEDALAALIKGRQADRSNFFDHLEAKYAGEEQKSKKKGKGKKRATEDEEMPSEEAFQATRAKLESNGKSNDGNGRKSKRAKR